MTQILVADVLDTIADWFNLSVDDLRGRDRHRTVAWPRHLAIYLSQQMTGHSLPVIGRLIGARNHSTILHSVRLIRDEVGGDAGLQQAVAAIRAQIEHLAAARARTAETMRALAAMNERRFDHSRSVAHG